MSATPVPRGRHAPPLEVRQALQRERLLRAAADVFARQGYADATAEAVAREAGMSKATFYEHFANKEECILAVFDDVAQLVLTRLAESVQGEFPDYRSRVHARIVSFIEAIIEGRSAAQTLLVEIIGAGPAAAERRDAILDVIADAIYHDNHEAAPKYGAPRYASREDAYICVSAVVEVVARQLRTGKPEDPMSLVPVLERLFLGVLGQGLR
ncbi:MAG TPA: TetR/AcrR family transcriptional regulator [Baekduia sp.]|nr:TetR/AcrR family transcriptional regulator [Baekduia sp.]